MTVGDYVAAFASILMGLAVADLAVSLHRLIRARSRIEWDLLPLAAALLVLLWAVNIWWGGYWAWAQRPDFGFGEFLPQLAILIALFLLAACALPDELPTGHFSLRTYHEENRAYFWTLFAVLALMLAVTELVTYRAHPETLESVFGNLAASILFASLAFARNRWFHAVLTVGFIIFALVEWSYVIIQG